MLPYSSRIIGGVIIFPLHITWRSKVKVAPWFKYVLWRRHRRWRLVLGYYRSAQKLILIYNCVKDERLCVSPLMIRQVAVYLETHCNVASKRAFSTGVLDTWHKCLLIYWRNVAQLPRPHRFVYFSIMTQQDVYGDRQRLPKIWVGTFLVRSLQPRGKTLNWF